MTVSDDEAILAMRHLAGGEGGDPPVVAGESGGAGFAGLVKAASDLEMRAMLDLGEDSRILLFNTEGATDLETYARLTGRTAEEVVSARSRSGMR
jgi:diaminopropionate ammonia-lyase